MTREARIQELLDKQEIHELVLLYCRGVDRKDPTLLRSLYTTDGVDHHGSVFCGPADEYVDFLEQSFPFIQIGAHYVCNHLITVDGDLAHGEVYALGYHILPTPDGGTTESFVGVRYLDQYRRENGAWLFARREVVFDLDRTRPVDHRLAPTGRPEDDPSYAMLSGPSFERARQRSGAPRG